MKTIALQACAGAHDEPIAERVRRFTAVLLRAIHEPAGHDFDSVLSEARSAIEEAKALRSAYTADIDLRR